MPNKFSRRSNTLEWDGTIMAENMSLCTFPTFLKIVAAWFTAYYTCSYPAKHVNILFKIFCWTGGPVQLPSSDSFKEEKNSSYLISSQSYYNYCVVDHS